MGFTIFIIASLMAGLVGYNLGYNQEKDRLATKIHLYYKYRVLKHR